MPDRIVGLLTKTAGRQLGTFQANDDERYPTPFCPSIETDALYGEGCRPGRVAGRVAARRAAGRVAIRRVAGRAVARRVVGEEGW